MDQRHNAYFKYLPCISVQDSLGNRISGSKFHCCSIRILLYVRIENELVVLCIYVTQDGAVFYAADGVPLFDFERDCQKIIIEEEEFSVEVQLLRLKFDEVYFIWNNFPILVEILVVEVIYVQDSKVFSFYSGGTLG